MRRSSTGPPFHGRGSHPRAAMRLLPVAVFLCVSLGAPSGLWGQPGQSLSEAAAWLQQYLRLDTTNPPGNEHRGAAFLARILRDEGIQPLLLVTPEGRTSLYARLEATEAAEATVEGQEGEALLLLHHIDVVPPGPDWHQEPFSGAVEQGAIWGRGAIDAKGLGIAHLAAFLELKRRAGVRHRDVIFLAVADEESGGGRGTAWLLEHREELFNGVAAVLNEGGVNRAVGERLLWWGVEVDQKRPLWLRVSARGRPGHASGLNPTSAVHKLVRALAGLVDMPDKYHVSEGARLYLEALAPLHPGRQGERFRNLDRVVKEDGFTEPMMPGMSYLFLDTVQVTVLEGGERINIVAGEASARVDVRLLPDTDEEAFLERVREVLGEKVEVEVLLKSPPGKPSPVDSTIFEVLRQELGDEAPVVPAFISGFTDSRYFRQRGIPAYGLSPFLLGPEELRTIHASNERISVVSFDAGVERMVRIVVSYASGNGGL